MNYYQYNSKNNKKVLLIILHEQINILIGKNLVNKKDLDTVLSHIVANLKPVYNIIKFKNCILDFNKFEVVENNDHIFTLVNIDLNYEKKPDPNITEFLHQYNEIKSVCQISF